MRQLKTFMRNRKAEMLGCGPCVCRTLQCWRYAAENCGCGEGTTEDMDNYILNWFRGTSVFNDLTSEQKEQALADVQEILEGAGDGIAPFYNAVRQGRTFSNYANKMGLDVDESGPCDSSLYEDEEAFIIYIGTAGAIDCKYLALVARRGRTPNKELINKEAISNYLDWVTTEEVTYQFKDWDDEILSFGSVKKGETPTAPTDLPVRPNYRFTGRSPSVGKIEYDTTFVAQYEEVAPVPVVSMSYRNENVIYVGIGETVTTTIEYLPLNANDFSAVTFDPDGCYENCASVSIASYNNGVATLQIVGETNDHSEYAPFIGDDRILTEDSVDINIVAGNMKVTEIHNFPESFDNINVGETKTFTFKYAPYWANDFSTLSIEDIADTYGLNHTTVTVAYDPYGDDIYGLATVSVTGTLEGPAKVGLTLENPGDVDIDKAVSFWVLPAGMKHLVSFRADSIRRGEINGESSGVAYAPEHGKFYLGEDNVLEIADGGSYDAETTTFLRPVANEGSEFRGWYYAGSCYSEDYEVKNGDIIEADTEIVAYFDAV